MGWHRYTEKNNMATYTCCSNVETVAIASEGNFLDCSLFVTVCMIDNNYDPIVCTKASW